MPLGLHWPINAIMLLNIQTLGYDFIQGPMGAWNFACFGATAGVLVLSLRHRDTQMRQTATGALAAGLLGGISEPSLYRIHLRFKRIYPRMLVGCFVGGLTIGIGSLIMGLPDGVTGPGRGHRAGRRHRVLAGSGGDRRGPADRARVRHRPRRRAAYSRCAA
ncbi:phosphotransferase system glucose/maltose/N-acetylglucosamine-specific IIC component [Microbacterium sp. BE35]|nr:phosphotransferase system glucose/maltose/N-acetylglucosamine-specific IIC component [Microbacterium sp. BE35]